MKEVAVFGGTFDPPTVAHESIIAACLALPGLDEVWVMPSAERVDKQARQAYAGRLAMLEAMKHRTFHDDARLIISDFEQRLPRPTRTCRTVRSLRVAYPENRFWFVYGADSYQDMPNWRQGGELRRELDVLLVARAGYSLPPESDKLRHLELPEALLWVSSTVVRAEIAHGHAVSGFLSPGVAEVISNNKLYEGSIR